MTSPPQSAKHIFVRILQSQTRWIPDQTFFTLSDIEKLISDVKNIFTQEKTTLQLTGTFVVIGDLHGDISTLVSIFSQLGYPPNTQYIFLGDYVDRGLHSTEVILLLFALKVLYPTSIYLLRGNHEFSFINNQMGFSSECSNRFGSEYFDLISSVYPFIPICAILNDDIFCVHGGISQEAKDRNSILSLEKPGEYVESGIAADLLWSDPLPDATQFTPSPRGVSFTFGYPQLKEFLSNCGFRRLIRGHEFSPNGFSFPFENHQCITIFSVADYCQTGSLPGYCVVSPSAEPELHQLFNQLKTDQQNEKRRIIAPEWAMEEFLEDDDEEISPPYLDINSKYSPFGLSIFDFDPNFDNFFN